MGIIKADDIVETPSTFQYLGDSIPWGINLEYMGSSTPAGLNIEYSPNRHFDFGLGTALPAIPELHLYARYDLLSYIISPYIELSSTIVVPGKVYSECQDWFFGRVEAGGIFRYNIGLYVGLGIGYQLIGSYKVFVDRFNDFFPSAFIGWHFSFSHD
jgi:hypothetical protein